MTIFLVTLIVIYFFWCQLEKYNTVDYGNRQLNRLLGLNQLLCRKYHKLGDYWLDLPTEGGVVIAANHQSGMDPAVLIAASKRRVRFLATEYYYNIPFVKNILKTAGCIPVYRSKDNRESLRKAIEALKNGEVIGIFPFGGIHLSTKEEPRLRTGVAVLSKSADVPIYPVHIGGVNEFSHDRVFTSMFFRRSTLKVKQFHSIKSDLNSENFTQVLDYLYPLLSNHHDVNKSDESIQQYLSNTMNPNGQN